MRTQEKRFHWIQALHRKAKDHFDLELLRKIETGDVNVKQNVLIA
jgi:hypothetical protein